MPRTIAIRSTTKLIRMMRLASVYFRPSATDFNPTERFVPSPATGRMGPSFSTAYSVASRKSASTR